MPFETRSLIRSAQYTMSFPLSYCPSGEARLRRLRSLYEDRAQDRILGIVEAPTRALATFAAQHGAGYSDRPAIEERLRFWDELLRERMAIEDDSIPCAYLSELDQGLYGGMVGGSVQYMAHPENGWISSMVPPILKDWPGLDALTIDSGGECYRYFLDMLHSFRECASDRFGVSHFILIDGLNFVFELFGATRTYLETADNPDRVRQAIDFAYALNVQVQQTFFANIELVEGGTCSNMAGWLPGRIVSESVDPFHMTSPDFFERWGREPVERMLAAFDGGVLHIHGNGRHLLRSVATIRGLKAISLLNDTGYAPAIFELHRLKAQTGDMPLIVDVLFPDFADAFERRALAGGTLYKIREVPDADTANRWMDKIRAYVA